jgi:hypothetical protein
MGQDQILDGEEIVFVFPQNRFKVVNYQAHFGFVKFFRRSLPSGR